MSFLPVFRILLDAALPPYPTRSDALPVVLIAAVVVIAAAVLFFVLRKRRKQRGGKDK